MQARMTNPAMIFSDASNPTATHIRFTTRLDSGRWAATSVWL